ncbi:MAG: metallophosphoesterase family protein [Nitrospira sp.]|nr:metallophosphoesterase family protein [Nitrospira sp.]
MEGGVTRLSSKLCARRSWVELLAGHRIAISHILYEGGKLTKGGRVYLQEDQPELYIFGHTHQPKTEWLGKTMLFNPGSEGSKRFKLPQAVGILEMTDIMCKPRHIELKPHCQETPRKMLDVGSLTIDESESTWSIS